jgi:hypothetical protein
MLSSLLALQHYSHCHDDDCTGSWVQVWLGFSTQQGTVLLAGD